MKEFNEEHIKDLQEAHGFVLQDVKGKTVAIGLDSEYPDIASFLGDYIETYGIYNLSKRLGYEDSRTMLNDLVTKTICFSFAIAHIKTKLMGVFNGISADDYAKKLENKQWHLGDVVEEDGGHRAMIVKDNDGDYILMDIDPDCADAFQVSEFFEYSSSLKRLREISHNWHKAVED